MEADISRKLEQLTNQVDRLNSTVRTLVMERKKKTWVNAEWIIRLTGWNKEELRQAREGKLIEFRQEPSRRIKYVLESIPEQFLKKQTA